MSDFEHWIWWFDSLFALLAEIKVISDSTLVSYTQNRISSTSIADDFGVNNFGLLLPLFLEVSGQQLLVLLSAIGFHLIVQDFVKILEEFIVNFACSIALLAWKTIFVDHFSIALEALWEVVKVLRALLPDHILWSKDEAAHHLLISNCIFLTGLRFRDNLSIAHGIFGYCLALRGILISFDHDSDIFIMSIHSIGIAAETVLNFLVAKILNHISSICGLSSTIDIVISASNRV